MIIISFGAHHIPFVYTLAASHRAPSLALVHSFVRSFIHSFIHSFINEDSACLGPFFYFLFSVFFSSSSRDSRQSHHVLLPLAVLNNNNNNKKNNNNNHHHNQVPPSPFFVSSKQQINKAANVSLAVFFLPSPFFFVLQFDYFLVSTNGRQHQ